MLSILPFLPVLAAQAIFQPPGPAGSAALTAVQPQAVLRAAIDAIERRPSFSASIRHQVHLFDKHLFGSGSYQELRQGGTPMIRLELSTQIGDQVSSFLQVCDGKCLWTYRKLFDETTLTRVDAVRRTRSAPSDGRRPRPGPRGNAPRVGRPIAVAPRPGRQLLLHHRRTGAGETAREVPARLEAGGRLAAGAARAAIAAAEAAIEQGKPVNTTRLSKHLPDRVVLLLGQEDLFPYRIEYRRQVDKKEASEGEETRSLVTMELYEVNLNALAEPTRFLYNPGSMEPEDQTESFLLSLGAR